MPVLLLRLVLVAGRMRYKYVPLLSNGVKPLNELEAIIVLLPVLFVSVLFRYVIVVGMVIEPSVN